jgi:hypothetical protein
MPATIHAICADSTYIYGKSSGTDTTIRRWSISTLTAASNLTTSQSTTGFPATNPGFIDHYNGFIYLRGQGSSGTVWIINTSNGVTTSIDTAAQSENLGGLVTVNTAGVPFLVEYQDTQYMTINLNTMEVTIYSGLSWTDPTTTSGNRAAAIANGIVLFNNGSYGTCVIVDVNGATPVATQVTNQFPMGNASAAAMISKPFQTAPVNVTREVSYNLLASGVEST